MTTSVRSRRPVERSSPLNRLSQALTRREWLQLGGMTGFILLLYIAGWGTMGLFVIPQHLKMGTNLFGLATGMTAFTLGCRHAFDADHIAAIDNTTRKLMAQEKRPLSVGFWFSLGHSTIVFVLTALLAIGIRSLGGQVTNTHSALHSTGGLVGTLVSGSFLMLIAIMNLVVLVGIIKLFRQMRRGVYNEAALEKQLNSRGFMNRILGRVMKIVSKPRHMYPVGVLFGLGFDTATEVALLVLAGTGAVGGLPWYALLCLPVLFAAGMATLDTIDGSFMNFAYGWAFSKPVRKVYYNITITGLSVCVAMIIGGIELLTILQAELKLGGPFWAWISRFNINTTGFWIVGLFIATWIVALAYWRLAKVEQKWDIGMQKAASRPPAS